MSPRVGGVGRCLRDRLATPAVVMVCASGPAYVAIGYLGRAMNPALLTMLRLGVCAAAMTVAVAVRSLRRRWSPLPGLRMRDLPAVTLCGVLGYAGYSVLLALGQRTVPSGTTSLLVNAAPVITAAVGLVALRERLTWQRIAGTCGGFLGTALISFSGGGSLRTGPGALWIIAAALSLTGFVIVQQKLLARTDPLSVTAAASVVGALLSLVLLPWARTTGTVPILPGVLAVLVLGVLSTAVAYTAWAAALRTRGASGGALLMFVVPVISLVLGVLLLGEHPTPAALAGGVLAVLGVWFSDRGGRAAGAEPQGVVKTKSSTGKVS
ncbi:MAG: DMT family transporter [Acidipropionibacterium sp.]|nr:DMT family transporter [Acidipropionibacterium sp.]